jgi:hypothetical protein
MLRMMALEGEQQAVSRRCRRGHRVETLETLVIGEGFRRPTRPPYDSLEDIGPLGEMAIGEKRMTQKLGRASGPHPQADRRKGNSELAKRSM